MALTFQGTAGGQDAMRRAAMQYAGGAQASPAQEGMAPQTSVGSLLAEATKQTLASPDPQTRQANLAAWKQAVLFLGEQMNAGGGAAPQPPAPGPNAMQQFGAQAMAPMVGRPPR